MIRKLKNQLTHDWYQYRRWGAGFWQKCQMKFIYFMHDKLILFKAPPHPVIFYFEFLKKKNHANKVGKT